VVEDVIARVESRLRPVLVYDGDCAFCARCVRVLERIGPEAGLAAWQDADLATLGITEEQAAEAVQWVSVDGAVRSGHEAIAATLDAAGGIWRISGRLILLPGISSLAALAYRLVADNRHRLPGGTPACKAQETRRSTSRSIFARRLALSLLLALAAGRIRSPSRNRSSRRGSI
jgi:predicted DCC family thiol-disulfide oxidoreductase YuxK